MYKKRTKSISKFKILLVIVLIFIIVRIISYTVSRYQSIADSNANIDLAYYVLGEDYGTMNVNLGLLLPREEPYIYTFSISNNDGTNRVETNLQYDLTIKTTTNLPLQYELYKNESYDDDGAQSILNPCVTDTDTHSTYFHTFTTATSSFGFLNNEQNVYQLVVYFPSEYTSIDYQDVIENIEIIIESEQII